MKRKRMRTPPMAPFCLFMMTLIVLVFKGGRVEAQNKQPADIVSEVKESIRAYRLILPKLQGKYTQRNTITFKNSKHEDGVTKIVKDNATSALLWEQSKDEKNSQQFVYGRNAKYAFLISNKNDKGWVLLELEFGNPNKIKYSGTQKTIDDIVFEVVAPQFMGFVPGLPSLDRLFADQKFRLLEPNKIAKEKGKAPSILFEYSGMLGKNNFTVSQEIWFDPEKHWGQERIEDRYEGKEGKYQGTVEIHYKGKLEAFAKPAEHIVSGKMVQKSGETSNSKLVGTYNLWLDDSVPDADFTLSAFGLPEPKGIVWDRPSHSWLWIGLAGIGILTLGFVFHRFLRRGNASTSVPGS